MGRYHVLAKVAKPYQLSNGDVVVARPRRGAMLVIPDECDGSESILRGIRTGALLREKLVVKKTEAVVVPKPVLPKVKSREESKKKSEPKPVLSEPVEVLASKPVEDVDLTALEEVENTDEKGVESSENKKLGKWKSKGK